MANASPSVSLGAGSSQQTRPPVEISGHAQVHLGDNYIFNQGPSAIDDSTKRSHALASVLSYEGADLKRDQLTLSYPASESFAWVEQSRFPVWLSSSSHLPFWVKGKPASGKSTLMKYLAEDKTTADSLNGNNLDGTWTVVYFFFDYRAGNDNADNVLGMLKQFMKQLDEKVRAVSSLLEKDPSLLGLLQTDIQERYIDALTQVVITSGSRVCAFVDGLDEFERDLWDLCSTLDRIRRRTGMRMCLASRSERAFEVSFEAAGCPTLNMQEHNTATILAYLHWKVANFEAENVVFHGIFSSALQQTFVKKAQGIILWARLTMDELLKTCATTVRTITSDLFALLDSMPPDLEPIYERILNKLDTNHRSGVALLLLLLVDNEVNEGTIHNGSSEPDLLCQAHNYLQVIFEGAPMLTSNMEDEDYARRITGLLGNLVEIVKPHKDRPTYSIRLIHKSFSSYLSRSGWIDRHIPGAVPQALQGYPNQVWQSIVHDLFERTSSSEPANHEELERWAKDKSTFDMMSALERGAYMYSKKLHKETVTKLISVSYQGWAALICYCIYFYYRFNTLQFPAVAIDLAWLHYKTCNKCAPYLYWGWYQDSRIATVHDDGMLYCLLELIHGRTDNFLRALEELLEAPLFVVPSELFDAVLLTFAQRMPHWYWPEDRSLECLRIVLRAFAARGMHVEPRHICMAPALLRYSSFTRILIESAKQNPLKDRAYHDKDCPDKNGAMHVGEHWLLLNTLDDRTFLEFLIALDVDLEEVFYKQGGIFHAILLLASSDDKTLTDKAITRFLAAEGTGLTPCVVKGKITALQLAKKLQGQSQSGSVLSQKKGSRSNSHLSMIQERYVFFLDSAIETLTELEQHGKWTSITSILWFGQKKSNIKVLSSRNVTAEYRKYYESLNKS